MKNKMDRFGINLSARGLQSLFMYSSQNKRSIFKLSGNMALGGNIPTPRVPDPPTYTAEQLTTAKNSLRLLKSKQAQKQSVSNFDYQKDYAPSYNNYSNYQKYGAGSFNDDKYTKPMKMDNEFMEIDQGYKPRNNSRNAYQSSKLVEPEYPAYTKSIGKPATESRRKQNLSQNKYLQEELKEKPVLPLRNRQGQGQQRSNIIEEKPISELKKTSQQNIPQEYVDDVELVECKAGCGRKFNPSVLRTHEKVCKKVFLSKRKEFNAQEQRVAEADQKKLQRKGMNVAKKIEQQKPKANQKMPKWKAQSLQFRKILKGQTSKPMNAQQQKQYQQAQDALKQAQGYIKCPTCARSFNEKAGTRHIPVCAQQAKKNKFKK